MASRQLIMNPPANLKPPAGLRPAPKVALTPPPAQTAESSARADSDPGYGLFDPQPAARHRPEPGLRPKPETQPGGKAETYTPDQLKGETRSRAHYERLADAAAARHRLDPHLVRAVISAESSFNPTIVSRAGAMGLMQLMPGTAKDMEIDDPFDPAQNIEGGTKYLAWLYRKFDGDENKILAAYNWGPGNVERGGKMPAETRNYLQRVRKFREEFRQASLAPPASPSPQTSPSLAMESESRTKETA
jgi:hypothetical protein